MNKFEERAIMKQDEAYKVGFAKKQMGVSCSICCSQNKRPCGTCAQCPIKEAHIRALLEIQEGKRGDNTSHDTARKSYHRNKDRSVTITVTIHF